MDLMVQGLKKTRAADTVPVLTAPSCVAAIISSFTAKPIRSVAGAACACPGMESSGRGKIVRAKFCQPFRVPE
jgi:hypothetical protein